MSKCRIPAWSTGLRPAHKNMGEGVQTSNWIYTVCATRLYLLYVIIWRKIKGDYTQKIHPLYLYNMHKPLLSVHLNTAQSPPETALMLPFPDQQEQSVHDARFNPAKQAAVKCFPAGYFKPASRFLQAAPTKAPYRRQVPAQSYPCPVPFSYG